MRIPEFGSRRRIVQIAAISSGFRIHALCSDGSVWALDYPMARDSAWFRCPDIPQDPPESSPLQDQVGAEAEA